MAAEYVATSARWVVGAILLAAGFAKLRSPEGLVRTVSGYGILPEGLARPAAILLPPFETVLGLLLLLGIAPRITAAASAALFAAFVLGMSWNVARGNDIPCGCFGAGGVERVGPAALLRNTLLLGISVLAALLASPYLALAPLSNPTSGSHSPSANGIPLALISGAVLMACALAKRGLALRKAAD